MTVEPANTNNVYGLEADQNTFERFESRMKNKIFEIVFVLLKDQETSIHISSVFVFVQFLQIIAFSFNSVFTSIWSYSNITDVLETILGFFNIVTYVKETNWSVYVTILYVGIFIIAFVIIDAIFVSYGFSRKKLSFSWPAIILKNIFRLFTTILFLPLVDYFISMLACITNSNGTVVHSFFSEVECWDGMHILHTIFALFGILIFVSMTLVVCLLFFEYKNNSNDATARTTSRPNFVLNAYQLIMSICITFLTDKDLEGVLIALILLGSIIIFIEFSFNPPYHNEIIAKLSGTLAAINLWGACMLVFAGLLEDNLFEGSVFVWLVGIPFIAFIHLAKRDHRVNNLLININKFRNGTEIQNQIRFVLKLIKWKSHNKHAATLLDGYIGIHKQSCNEEDCPLRQKIAKNNRLLRILISILLYYYIYLLLLGQDENLNEKYALLVQLLQKIYSDGLKRFPKDTSLRISYAFFLMERMHNKQQALQELAQAEQCKPSFDEQFIIFRYKKIFEDEIAENQNESQGGLDIVAEVSFQNHFQHLQANIEKSALLHMEFWSQLTDGNPDLGKMNDIGSKITASVQYIEDYWGKLQKVNPNNIKAIKLYAKFLVEIINDKDGGDVLTEKARNIMNAQANKKPGNLSTATGDGLGNEVIPTICMSGEQEKFAIITNINLAAANLFGYSKTEVLNQKVDMLMPLIYAKNHDAYIENYINGGETTIIGKKERFLFGKNKSGYIFPIYLGVKAVQSTIEGIQFIGTLRVEKNFKNAAYVLVNQDGTIDAISSSCINVLKLDMKSITQKKNNIEDYIPNIIKQRTSLFTSSNNTGKASASINYIYPKDSDYLLENDEPSVQLVCHIKELVFLNGKQNAGFELKFERAHQRMIVSSAGDVKPKISNFQFRFEANRPFIIGEYVQNIDFNGLNDDNDDIISNLKISVNNDMSAIGSFVSDVWKLKPQEEDSEVKRTNYGIGIKTLRLFEGKPQEIEEVRSDNGSEDENDDGLTFKTGNVKQTSHTQLNSAQQDQTQQADPQLDESSGDFSTAFKSRKALNTVVNDRTLPSTIKSIKLVANGLVLILISIAISDYILTIEDLNGIQKNIDLLNSSNQCLSEIMNVLSKTQDLNLLNLGLLNSITTEDVIKDKLQTALNNAKSFKVELDNEIDSLSPEHATLLNQPVIPLRSFDNSTTYKSLTQATEEILSRAFDMLNKPLSEIGEDQPEYYYITYNMLNQYYTGLRSSSNYYAIELAEKVDDNNNIFLLLMIGSILALIVTLLICFPILYKISKSREEILSLFLDIPERTVKGLYAKCETFLSNLQIGEEDDMISEIDEEDLDKTQGEHGTPTDLIQRKKRKHFKNSVKTQNAFFLKFLVMALCTEAYFLYNFITSMNLRDDITILFVELNSTSVAEPFYSFVRNAERQFFMDPSFMVLNSDTELLTYNNIKAMYLLDSSILEQHSVNRDIHTEEYTTIFNQIMMNNPCLSLGSSINQGDCENFADSTVEQGMSVALTRYFENLRALISCYSQTIAGNNCTFSVPSFVVPGKNSNETKLLNLPLTAKAIESGKEIQFE